MGKVTISTHGQFKRSIAFDRGCRLHGRVTRFHFCKEKYPELFVPGYDDGVVALPTIEGDKHDA